MVRQINPGLARLYKANLGRQYGYQEEKLSLDFLSSGQHRALDLLEQGVADHQIELLPKMANAPQNEVDQLLARLGGVLRTTSSFLPEFSELEVQARFSEILRLYASSELDPASAMKARHRSRVFVDTMAPIGLTLSRGLAAAGVGAILTDDQARIQNTDLGALGYPAESLGEPRASRAKQMLAEQVSIQQHNRITRSLDKVDVVVLCTTDVLNPKASQRWLSRDIPHLMIRFDELGVEVSHLVIPGITPCLNCVELNRLQSDQNWTEVATQLDYLDRDLGDAGSILFASSIALGRILKRIDQPLIEEPLTSIRLDFGKSVSEFQIAHSACGCS
jgi:molybdopterin/thiamine biosynthesis adenylyltransferase